jgi:Phage integrase family
VRAALAKLGVIAGIEKRVHPHGLRHSLAFDMAMTGVPTHQIQAPLGHSVVGDHRPGTSGISPRLTLSPLCEVANGRPLVDLEPLRAHTSRFRPATK